MTENTQNTDREASDDEGIRLTRRDALAGLAGLGMGAAGALGTAEAVSANPQGQLGTSADPLAGAFVEQLAGPISDTGDPISQLVNVRLEEAGTSVSPAPNTLVIFYNP